MEKRKKGNTLTPIEKHDTAAWANVYNTKPESNVPVPSEVDVSNAKEYVDTNEK